MAFLEKSGRSAADTRRFSLLLLKPGEEYFEDFSVNFYQAGIADQQAIQRQLRGRLKICSQSLVFDPQDLTKPLLKFPLKSCTAVRRHQVPLMSPLKGDVLAIETTKYVKIREDNLIKPYQFVTSSKPKTFLFSTNYVSLQDVVTKTSKLQQAWQKGFSEREEIIAEIAQQHEQGIEFNLSWLEDLSEQVVIKCAADRVTPLVSNRGRVLLTTHRLYFQPFNDVDSEPVQKYRLTGVSRAVKRRYLLRDVGLELFLPNDHRLYLAFKTSGSRDDFYKVLVAQEDVRLQPNDQVNVMLAWQNGAMSNFDYLMYLNSMADRSFNDLTQYPVFPWVIADYTSDKLDLDDPATFRDLSKPIGALNPDRLEGLVKRYEEMPSPKFLYGTHYSTPGYVLFYTIRAAPEYALCLQNGKWDHADRLFTSVKETWDNVLTGAADVKELIPDFYMPPGQFLANVNALDLGATQDGVRVSDVELPPWASSAEDFTRKCREALECPYVSENIHHWIDLIFGYKQRGPESIKANNVFYYLTYEGAINLDEVHDPAQRAAFEAQITEFGQTPKQLFTIPHPHRRVLGTTHSPKIPRNPLVASRAGVSAELLVTPSSNTLPALFDAHAVAPSGPVDRPIEDVTLEVAAEPSSINWSGMVELGLKRKKKVHRDAVTCVCLSADNTTLFTVSQDSCLKVFSLETQDQLHSVTIGDLALSSCAVLPTSQSVVVSSWDNSVYFYSIEYGRLLDSWAVHDDAVSDLILRDGLMVTASWDSTIKVWTMESEDLDAPKKPFEAYLGELAEHSEEVSCLDYNTASKLTASGGKDGLVMIWDLATRSLVHSFEAHHGAVHGVAWSPDGRRVVSCGEDNMLKVWDIELLSDVFSVDAGDELHCVAFDGQVCLAGGESGALYIWDVVSGNRVKAMSQHTGPVRCLAVSSDGLTVVTGADDKCVCVWTLGAE
eukprot:m.358163 g.358163  ORF g.358163 m.358163 type:complete len:945 (-) comp19945_c1_seq18:166-3000(-)